MSFSRISQPPSARGTFGLLGQAPILLELVRQLELIAGLSAPVLLEGEHGVGRALAAAFLHQSSPRALAPFLGLNAAEISPALFESELFGVAEGAFAGALASRPGLASQAEPGTLLVEEVGILPAREQAMLARFLDSHRVEPVGGGTLGRRVDVRVVLTATRPGPALDPALRAATAAFTLMVPPLRSRVEDLPLLALHFAREAMVRHAKRIGDLTPEAVALLAAYPWPGNVQELEEEMERAVILTTSGEPITAEVLSAKVSGRNRDPLGTGFP